MRHVLRPLLLLLVVVLGATAAAPGARKLTAAWLLNGAYTTGESFARSPSCQLLQHARTATAAAGYCCMSQQALQLHTLAAAVTQHALIC